MKQTMPSLGSDLCTGACLVTLWADSNISWWWLVGFIVTGWAINMAVYITVREALK